MPGDQRLHVERWGAGTPVVLVHGSLAVAAEEWAEQRPLAERGFELLVFDRRGYGHNAGAAGEDFLVDADDICELLGDGAHLVGHSYGGLGAMIAAARRPEATRSLTLLEAPASGLPAEPAAWRTLIDGVQAMWSSDAADRDWVVQFLTAVGSDPTQFPPEFLDVAEAFTPVFRNGRPFHHADLPFAALAAASFPKLIVSGGHSEGFDTMCAQLAVTIGGTHVVVPGAGHEIQFVGEPLNSVLADLWR
jgi:pimeloyl-ACP methyl ester carboxylesterase